MNNLYYGRPKDNKLRKYYNDTRFNLNSLVREHLNESQLLQCENGHEFPFELLDKFKAFGMQCLTCLQNKVFSECKVISSNRELLEKIKEYEKASLNLDDINEYNILDFINERYPKSFCCSEIGPEIDCSWQFVNKRANNLIERGLLALDEEKTQRLNKRYFKITHKSQELLG
jgi:hypothetical protein